MRNRAQCAPLRSAQIDGILPTEGPKPAKICPA
jgi:hypothetical protein